MTETNFKRKIPRTLVFSHGMTHNECINVLVGRNKIDLFSIDGCNSDYGSFPVSILHLLKNPSLFAERMDIPISEKMIENYPVFFERHFSKFWAMIERHKYLCDISRFDQVASYFNILYRYFYHIISSNNIDLLILFEIPHSDGYTEVLYQVAKLLNIKIILCHPCYIDNTPMIFLLPDMEALSNHDQLLKTNEKTIKIQQIIPSYTIGLMNDILQRQKKLNRCSTFFYPFYNIYNGITRLIKRLFIYSTNVISKGHIIDSFFIKRGIKLLLLGLCNIINGFLYQRRLVKFAKRESQINWNTKYIYFPLHNQPELSTLPLGDVYVDQLYAIECIARIIPNEWKIYVKENPLQAAGGLRIIDSSFIWRDWSFFFKRMQRNPQIVLVRENIDTNRLIEKSEFIATITGTAGWESILAGKSVLYFGNAWYGSFSGCTRFTSEITVDEILENQPDHNKIQDSINKLVQRLTQCCLYRLQSNSVKDFDINQNAQIMADAFEKYITYFFPEQN
ncbi:MAG: hypothetical protein LBG80_20715 [Bacteroidales bacterium]|jgi:hypothetical protein|nr:hypothetical protein [Bacteroidales bacterium]